MHTHYRRALLTTIMFFCIAAVVWGIFAVVLHRLRRDAVFVADAQARLAHYANNRSAWNQAKTQFIADTAAVAGFEKVVVTQDTVPDFLSTLERLATAAHISFAITSVGTDTKTAALTIAYSATGTYSALDTFLRDTQSLPQQIAFATVSLAEDGGSGATKSAGWRLDATIRVLSYHQ